MKDSLVQKIIVFAIAPLERILISKEAVGESLLGERGQASRLFPGHSEFEE